ncbi:MAG: DegT/DnrJ/EryC1/StrS family aminotransferase [Treponema sp.]|jgi:dTDP-4-amino-4,6-dideoxygalactose transaminase|nr:DegT/DnrJ/EryC1/StrS family aminotransferase [Treponema sp.]
MKIEVYSPTIRRKEMDAVLTAMVEEKIGPGERNRLLIQTAKERLDFDFALALRSPAVALYAALKSLNVNPGQAVVISALSPVFYLQVINDLQLTPLFCDVTYDNPCMNRELIENTIAKKPENLEVCAVVLHHTLGFVPDAASVAELGIPVIEDISQSYGYWIKTDEKNEQENKSISPGEDTKNGSPLIHGVFCILGLEERDMLTSGGGALLFSMNRRDSAALRNFSGIADEYCLPDINAALAVVQFKEVQRNIEKRSEISRIYVQASLRTRHKRFIQIVKNTDNYYSFSLILETGLKDVIAYAKKKDILLENAFDKTIAGTGLCDNCPVSNSLVLRTVLFPMYPRLRSQDVEHISRLIMTLP